MNTKPHIPGVPQTPLRAERRANHDDAGQLRGVEATTGGLIRSTLIASGAAVAMLSVVYLPAEYGIDPTGFGAVLGLTEMGQIKQQLYAEAEADEAGAGAVATLDPVVVARLERIESQLASIGAVIGAPAALTEVLDQAAEEVAAAPAPEPDLAPAPIPALEAVAQPAPTEAAAAVDTAVTEATSGWRDEVSYSLAPGEGIEVKLVMQEGQTARFEWTANGSVVNYDTHGDGNGQKVSYEQGRGVPDQAGELTAAFTGNHGWFWRNRTNAPVTVTLRTAGDYAEMKAP
jgi:hypothetical protein